MNTSTSTLPHWDMTVVYPGLESPEFEAGFRAAVQSIDRLVTQFDQQGIDRRDPTPVDDSIAQTFESILDHFSRTLEEFDTLRAYVYSFITTDSRDALAQARFSELQQQAVRLSLLGTRWTAWIGSLDVEALIEHSAIAREHAFGLRKTKIRAAHLLSPAEEELAARLNLTGSSAWSKLHSNLTSQLVVKLELGGQTQELPISALRLLFYEPDREVRRQAYEAEQATWQNPTVAVPLAAALNSIKGEVNTLAQRRGWDSPLEATLFDSNIDRQTLDAVMTASRESFPDFRRYLRAKAKALGLPILRWYDLYAPIVQGREWSYSEATEFIVEQFGSYSPKLSGLAERAFQENWIDAEPRAGKRDGAFCMRLRQDQSRILSNFKPAFNQVSTLAHELGHAYHNLNLARRTVFQRSTPMTLAETASTFCETIVAQAALQRVEAQEQLAILEHSLQDACLVVLGSSSYFLFEQALFDKRQQRELSIDELTQMVLDSQRQTYGEALDPEALHPYRWALVPHFYMSGLSYYNFPYIFGLLFGLGLYAQYQHQPEAFRAGYDELLSSTGMGEAADLAAQFGIDIRSIDFWRASLDVIRADIDRFESLIEGRDIPSNGRRH